MVSRPLFAVVAAAGVALLVCLAGCNKSSSRVAETGGKTPGVGRLTEASGRVPTPAPLTETSGRVEPPVGPPQDVVDYLAFLKGIERKRVALGQSQLGELLGQSGKLTHLGLSAESMGENSEAQANAVLGDFRKSQTRWTSEWQALSAEFLAGQAPAACLKLRDSYYAVLGATSGSIAKVSTAFGDALAGSPERALGALSSMRGTASEEVTASCATADAALAEVCDQAKIRKDFDIRDDPSSGGLLTR